MNLHRISLAFILLAPMAVAQQWEAGGLGGFAFSPTTSVTNAAGSASTGFKDGFLVGAFGGSDDYARLGGEASYIYRQSDSMLSSGGQSVTLQGHTQFLDFRMLVHFAARESRVRPFVAVGGGVAVYSGTGQPNAAQPLNDFVALTNTRETKPMASGAVGIRYRITQHIGLRFEFRDYATPFPNRLIAPVPGTTLNGWAQNFVVMGGVSGIF